MKNILSWSVSNRICQRICVAALTLAYLTSLTPSGKAVTVYWDVNGATSGSSGTGQATGTWDGLNTFFNTDSTGAGGGTIAAWASGDTLVFGAGSNATNAYTVTVSGTQGIGGLTFEEGAVTLTGGTLQMTANSNFDVASGLTSTINSTIDGAFDLTKLGGGTLVLGGTNTYTGRTLINAGTLSISADANLGTAPGVVTADSINFTGSSTLQITGTGNPTINSNRGITLGTGVTGTVQVVDATNTVTYGGIVTGIAGTTFKKTGAGTLDLQGNSTSAFLGALNVDGGTLKLSGNGEMAGTSGVTIGNRGTLTLDNTATNLGNRTAGAIASSGGTINFIANAAATSETLGALTLNAGALTLNSTAGAGGSTITIPSITRNAGGTLYVNGTGLGGGTNQVVLTTANSLTNTILPWAVVNNGTVARFATHGGNGTSLTAQTTGYQASETAWGANTVNALPTASQALTATRTVYSLTLDGGVNLTASADRTLTIGSGGVGAVLQTGGTSTIGQTGTADNILAFGTNEAVFQVLGTLQIIRGDSTAGLTGGGGLTKSGPGTLILGGQSTLTGTYRINEGVLESRRGDSLNSTAQAVHLNGGTWRLSADAATTFTGNITVNADSTIQVDRVTPAATATTHTIGTLNIAGGRTLFVSSNDITSGTAYGLTGNALTINAGGATIDVANNGAGTGTMIVTSVAGAFPLVKTGAGDFLNNSTSAGYTGAVDIQAGRLGWGGSTGTITESQVFSGAGGILKAGVVVVNLTGANTFTGGVTVNSGTLGFSTVSDNGGSASNLGQGTDGITLGGGTLSFIGSTSQSTNRAMTLSATSTLAANGTGGASITYAGAIAAGASSATFTGTGTGSLTGGLTQTGSAADITINSGNWAFQTGTVTVADDITVVGTSTVLNVNTTGGLFYLGGGTSGTDATLAIQNGAIVNLGANDVSPTDIANGGLDRLILGQTTTGAVGTLNMNSFNLTTGRLDIGQVGTGFEGAVSGTGTVTVTSDINFYRGTISANLAGAAAVEKFGPGTVTFSGDNSGLTSGTAVRIDAGVLALNFATNNADKLRAATGLDMRGGFLSMSGNASAPSTQTVASLTLANGGAGKISLTSNGFATTLNLGAITRGALANDGTMRFETPTLGAITTTSANNVTGSNGILGGWATINDGTGVNFARNDGANNIVAATTTLQDDPALWTAGANMSDSSGFTGTLADCLSINSLRFNANGASNVTIPNGGALNIASGGVLMTSAATTGAHSITGGVLTSGTGELIFTQDSVAQGLTVSSSIVGASGVTKTGNGSLTLSGSNPYTGITDIQAGTLIAGGGNAIGDNSAVTLSDDQVSTLQITANETIGSISGGNATTGLVLGTVDVGSNTLTLRGAAAYAGVFTGSGSIVRSAALNSANFNLTGVSSGFTGTVVIDGGLLQLSGLGQVNASSFTVNKGGSFLIDNTGATRTGTRILDTTPITLNSADGASSGATIVRGLWIRTDQNATTNETVGAVNFNSGANYLSGDASGTTGISHLITDNFTRANNSTVDARARNMGGTANDRIQFRIGTTANQTAFITTLVGGGGAAGTQNISIVPWGMGENLTAGTADTNMGNSLITYVSGAGFRALDLTTEYDTIAAAAATDNARASLSGADLTGLAGATVNALVLHNADTTGNTTRNVTGTGAGQALAVTSGTMLFTRDTGAAGNYGITLGGFNTGITVGATNEYVIFVVNPDSATATKTLTATINSPLSSTADITKSGRGTLVLTTVNTAGGATKKTTLNEGTLQIGDLDHIGGSTGGLVFAGGTLQLGSAFDVSTDDVSTRTITFLNGGGTLDTNGKNPIFANSLGSGGGSFTKVGTGNLTLNAATTLTGGTTISAGEITLGANNAIGSGELNIAAGAVLNLGISNVTVGSVTTADSATNPITGTGTITASGNTTLNRGTFTPILAGTTNLIKNTAAQTVTMSSASNSFTGFTQVVDGTLAIASIANAGVNSPIGAPTGDNAAIRLGSSTTSGVLNITGAAMSTDRPIWLPGTTGGGTIDKDGTGELTLNADIKGIGVGAKTLTLQGTTGTLVTPNVINGEICELASTISLSKAEAGVWSLPNANTYSGTTTIAAGTLMIGNNGSLGTGTVSFTGGTLDNSGGNRTLANNVSMGGTGTLQGTGDFSFTGNFTETGGSRTLNINNVGTTTIGDSSADTLTLAENNQARTLTLAVSASSPTIINATIQDGTGTGTDNLTKSGAGTLTINAANTYGSSGVGQTNLGAGTIIAGNDAAFGTSLINVTAASTIQASATRALANNLQLNSTTAFSLTLGGSSALAFNGNIAQIGNSHTIAITNSALTTFGDASSDTLTLAENNQARTLTLDVGAGGLTINSTIVDGTGTGADNLIKAGTGTMTLNASNTYTGTTALQNGTTILGGGAADRLPTTTALTLGTGTNSATLQLGNGSGVSNQTLTSLATSGTGTANAIVGGNASNSTLTVNQATNTTFSGNLGGGVANQNNLNLVKSGVGELIVSGTSTYAGTTTVSGGKLFIDSTTGFPATNNTSLTVADGAEFSLRGTGLTGNVTYGFAGSGNVITLGSGSGTATLGFRLDGGFNTQLVVASGQTMSIATGSTFQTAIYVDDAPTAGQGYILINGADPGSLHAGGGTFNFTPVLFNGGSFTYTLTNETLSGTVDRWVITPTVQAAAADVWWKGDLTGLGTGVWTATTTNVGNESNWDTSQAGAADALVPPDQNSTVHFSANSAGNFATTLGGNLTIQDIIFHSGGTAISVGGANTLTIGNTVDAAGLTMQTGAPNVSFSANVALAQAQSFNIADAASTLTFTGGLSGTGPLGINDYGTSTGTMILSGTGGLAAYTGATNLAAGRLNLLGGANNRLPSSTDLTIGSSTLSAVLQLGDATNGVSNTSIGNLATSGTGTANAIVGGATTASILSINQTTNGTFNGVIGGAGTNENQVGFSKAGSATLILNGANTYTGASTITNGTVQLGAAGSINGTTALSVLASAGNTAVFDVNGRTAVLAGTLTLGGGDATAQAFINDTATGGLVTLGGGITFDATNNPLGAVINANLNAGAASRTFTVNDSSNAATDLTFNGTLAQSGGNLTIAGAGSATVNGAWTLSGTDRSITFNSTGTWTINAATNTTGTGDWNINSGVINATVSNALNANDHVIVDGTGVADSAIVNISGTAGTSGVHQGNDWFIRNGGRTNVLVSNGISTGTRQLFVGESASIGAAAGRLDLSADISIGASGVQLGATGGHTGNITGTGLITTAGTFSLRNGSIASGITLAGTGGITKVGDGTVTFAGTRTTSGATAIQEGNLVLDYTTNNASKIGGVLTLGAAQGNVTAATALTINANASGTTQSVTSTTISNTGDVLVDINDAGAATTLSLGAITRSVVGGTVSFDYSSANASATTSSAATGALGWATVTAGGTTRIGAISGGNIVQATMTTQNSVAAWGSLQNIINTAAYTGTLDPDCNTIASLTFDAAAASTVTIGSGSTLIITSGGILVNSGVGANPSTITGGAILGATTAPLGELMIHQNNTSGSLIINSDVVNSSGITKSGLGTLVLGGANTFLTGSRLTINEGTVQLSGGAAIGDSTIVIMRGGTTLDLNNSNETIGNLGVDTTNLTSGTIDLGSGTLTVNQTASSTFAGSMVGTGSLVKNGAGNITFTSNSTFSGSLTLNGGNVTVNGAGGFLASVGTYTLNAAEFLNDQNDGTERNRVGDAADFILNNTAGTNGLFQRTNQGNTKTENIGDIRIGAGHNVVTSHGSVTNAISVLQADTLTRLNTASQNHGTVLVRGNNLGASSGTRGTIAFDSGAQTTINGFEVGGGGAAGTTNVSIIPWMAGHLSETGLGNTFVTNVDATVGLRPLASTEYINDSTAITGTLTDNIRYTVTTAISATPTAINSLVLDSGTAIALSGSASSIEITAGAILAAGNANHSISGISVITTGGGRDYVIYNTGTGTLTLDPALTSAVALVKAGQGTLALTNTGNAFTDVYLNQGALQIDGLNKVNGTTNALHFFGGTLRLAAGFADDPSTKPWDINTGGGTLDVSLVTANSGVVTLANGIDDTTAGSSDTLTVVTRSGAAAGQLVIQGASSFTGTTVFNHTAVDSASNNSVILNGTTNAALNGNVQIGSLGTIPNTNVDVVVALGASEQIVDTATLSFRGTSGEQAYFKLMGFTETVAGISDSSNEGIVASFETGDTTPSGPSTLILNSSQDFSFSGFFRDTTNGAVSATAPLALTKQGSGTQTLSGVNVRHSGTTTISGGALTLIDVTNWSSAITNNATLNLNQTTGSRTHTQAISGTGTLIKLGAGTVVLGGTNTYSGQTRIEQGVLSISSSANLGDGSATNTIRIANNATLQSTGANVDLTANRSIAMAGLGATIDVTSTNILTAPGQITGDDCQTLTKTGTGVLVVNNASNAYTALTSVTAGVLQIGSGGTAGTSGVGQSGLGQITVASGAALAGSGTVQAPVVLNSGATLLVGEVTTPNVITASSVTNNRTLTFTAVSGTSFAAGSTTKLSITDASNQGGIDATFGGNDVGTAGYTSWVTSSYGTATGDHDRLVFTGANPTLAAGAEFAVIPVSFTAQFGQIFNIVDWASALSGFAIGTNYRDGSSDGGATDDLDLPDISATSGLGWDVSMFQSHGIIVVVPEPSRCLLAFFGLLALVARRRRR